MTVTSLEKYLPYATASGPSPNKEKQKLVYGGNYTRFRAYRNTHAPSLQPDLKFKVTTFSSFEREKEKKTTDKKKKQKTMNTEFFYGFNQAE